MAKIEIQFHAAVRIMCRNVVAIDDTASQREIIAACKKAMLEDLKEGLLDDLIEQSFDYEPEDIEILSHEFVGIEPVMWAIVAANDQRYEFEADDPALFDLIQQVTKNPYMVESVRIWIDGHDAGDSNFYNRYDMAIHLENRW